MKGFIRVWKECDFDDIERSLLVVGELSADCYVCRKIGIDTKARICPNCGVGFKYVGFRKRIDHPHRLREEFPEIILIDFDDFKKAINKREARKLLDI